MEGSCSRGQSPQRAVVPVEEEEEEEEEKEEEEEDQCTFMIAYH
jgi:ribosomal protein L12E/L44/L45/RPP1/RPP2